MIRSLLAALCVLTIAILPGSAAPSDAPPPSPYAGFETRDIKALSEKEMAGLLDGHGLGMALPAELNGYPGPKHVLELADALELGPEQREATERIFDAMHVEAVRLGERVIEGERRLDALFAGDAAAEPRLREQLQELGSLRADLRFAHLSAHLAMRELLTEEQLRRYDRLRGYVAGHRPGPDCPHAGADGD